MKSQFKYTRTGLTVVMIALLVGMGCDTVSPQQPTSTTGVTKATATVEVGSDGMTAEQRNIADRVALENAPGSIKYLYIISAMSGQVILASTVRGKVTSSSKRLTPKNGYIEGFEDRVFPAFGVPGLRGSGRTVYTSEVLGDDGTYGSSVPYFFWFDTEGRYHQHFFTGGQIIHLSDQPISVGRIMIDMIAHTDQDNAASSALSASE